MNPLEDNDGDGLNDGEEPVTDPDNDGLPCFLDADSNGDGMRDGDELKAGKDPFLMPAPHKESGVTSTEDATPHKLQLASMSGAVPARAPLEGRHGRFLHRHRRTARWIATLHCPETPGRRRVIRAPRRPPRPPRDRSPRCRPTRRCRQSPRPWHSSGARRRGR